MSSVRGRDAGRPIGPVEAITRGGHPCRVGEDVGERSTVPWIIGACVASYYEALEPHCGRDGHRGWEDIVIPVTSQEYEFRNNNSYQPIGFIAGPHGGIVSTSRHFVYKVGSPTMPFP